MCRHGIIHDGTGNQIVAVGVQIGRANMNVFFTSDTHFGHGNIIKYSNRPFRDADQMNEALIANWNAIVKPDDTVWHLGDFAFMQASQFKAMHWRLNGNIHIVLGNHDKLLTQNRNDILRQGKIKSIQNYAELKVDDAKGNGRFIVLFHYGQRVWNKSHHGSIHLYGHSHGSLPPHGLSVDVGVDCKEITEEYRPVSLDEVCRYMDRRKISVGSSRPKAVSFKRLNIA